MIMGRVFKIEESTKINWPASCIVCGDLHFRQARTTSRVFTGIGYRIFPEIKYRIFRHDIPLCNRHFPIFKVLRYLHTLSNFLLVAFFITLIGGAGEWTDGERFLVFTIGPIAIALFFITSYFTPFRVTFSGKNIIKIRKETCVAEFERLNVISTE